MATQSDRQKDAQRRADLLREAMALILQATPEARMGTGNNERAACCAASDAVEDARALFVALTDPICPDCGTGWGLDAYADAKCAECARADEVAKASYRALSR